MGPRTLRNVDQTHPILIKLPLLCSCAMRRNVGDLRCTWRQREEPFQRVWEFWFRSLGFGVFCVSELGFTAGAAKMPAES